MDVGDLVARYEVKPAIAAEDPKYKGWVCSTAREVNPEDPAEIALVRDLSAIMHHSLSQYLWRAVSSNNLYWNGTNGPIRVITVPHPERDCNLTIANPQIKKYGGKYYESVEGCGSFPGNLYAVKRKSFVKVTGHLLGEAGFTPVELGYGSRNVVSRIEKEVLDFNDLEQIFIQIQRLDRAAYVQHEVDHLDGITIVEKGTPKSLAGF